MSLGFLLLTLTLSVFVSELEDFPMNIIDIFIITTNGQ